MSERKIAKQSKINKEKQEYTQAHTHTFTERREGEMKIQRQDKAE